MAALDAIGGGFIGSALIAYFLYARFGVNEAELALLFVAARLVIVASHFAAAWLARRIGLVNTMVFTHPIEPAAVDVADRADLRRRSRAFHSA